MTSYGMPFLLEDKTGKLTGSDFVDINDRLRLALRCTARGPTNTAYMIYDRTYTTDSVRRPLAVLDFGSNNSLGTITFGSGAQMLMSEFLVDSPAPGRLVSIIRTLSVLIVIQHKDEEVCRVRWPCIPMELEECKQRRMDGMR
jgi:hypothetical protein